MQGNQQSTAAEQGNDREQCASPQIARPSRIGRKAQPGEVSNVAGAQERPKQDHGSDQDGAVKERVEIVARQKRKYAGCCKGLSRPEKKRSNERSPYNDGDKIRC